MENERSIKLGTRVKLIRKEMHISQRDFAEKINISGSFLSEIEAGKSKPGYDFFYNISRTCNVSVPYLLHGVGGMFTDIDYKPDITAQGPVDGYIRGMDEVLWYTERSPLFRHTVLGFAAKFLYDNEAAIKKELERFNEEKKDKMESPTLTD